MQGFIPRQAAAVAAVRSGLVGGELLHLLIGRSLPDWCKFVKGLPLVAQRRQTNRI
jgi:hypothetical protein